MRPDLVLSVTALGLSLLPLLATSGLAQTTAPQPAIIHMIYHDAEVTGKNTTTSTIEDQHVLASAQVHGNKVTLNFNAADCEVYESGVHTYKGCNWSNIQGNLKVESKYSPSVDNARSKNALSTTITFDTPAKAVAFKNIMLSTQPPVLAVTAADVTRSPSSVDEHIHSSNILLRQAGTTSYQSFDSYLSASLTQSQVPSEAQKMMTKIKMEEADDSKENPSVFTNHSKDGIAVDADKPALTPEPVSAGHL
jgi:hypothetical protein